jgi:hypothetical protein
MRLCLDFSRKLSFRPTQTLRLCSSVGGLSLMLTAMAFGVRGQDGLGVGLIYWNDILGKPPITARQDFLNTNTISFAHNMQKYVGFEVLDTAGTRWLPKKFSYPSINEILIEFDTAFSGTVYLN